MRKKVIIVLSGFAIVICSVALMKEYVIDKQEPDKPPVTMPDPVIIDTNEDVERKTYHLSNYDLEKIIDARDPFSPSPIIVEEYREKEDEYLAAKRRLQERLEQIRKEQKEEECRELEEQGLECETDEVKKTPEEILEEELQEELEEKQEEEKDDEKYEDAPSGSIKSIIHNLSDEYSVDKEIVTAVIGNETNVNLTINNANGTEDRGLMQINTRTAPWLAKMIGKEYEDGMEYNKAVNIEMGYAYLNYLWNQHTDEHYVLTAYHMGPGGAENLKSATGSYESSYSRTVLKRIN